MFDLPGIFQTEDGRHQTEEDVFEVKELVKNFISRLRTVVLAILPAPAEIANQHVFNFLHEHVKKDAVHKEFMDVMHNFGHTFGFDISCMNDVFKDSLKEKTIALQASQYE